ncbi:MAG: hypothetical protein DMF25_10655, partial [Verrucomicrobia bacterium]
MSLIPFAPLYLGCSRRARPLPRGLTGHVAHPSRSIQLLRVLAFSNVPALLRSGRVVGIWSLFSQFLLRCNWLPFFTLQFLIPTS